MADPPRLPEVVIVGAGFAGLRAARRLRRVPVRVTVVDRRNYHLFQPLLYQVATAALDPSDIAYPIRAIFSRQANVARVLLAEVTAIDLERRRVVLDDCDALTYDKLIVAAGATDTYFGHDEWAASAPSLKSVEDALAIRRRILSAFERAERYPERMEQALRFVVIGGGPTGVELAGAIVEIAFHELARDFDVIDPKHTEVLLLEGGPRVLPTFPEDLSESARRQLEALGVVVRTDAFVTAVDEDGVTLKDGTHIEADTVLWAAGVRASPLGAALGVPLLRDGRVPVAEDLSLPGHPDVFVAGDLAAVENDGQLVPGVAPAAIQQGEHVARQIARDLHGLPREPFRYRDKGLLATIGRARAVAVLGRRLRFSGFLAWLAWIAVHIFFLIGFRNRLFVLLSWGWNWLTFRRGARLITGGRRLSSAPEVELEAADERSIALPKAPQPAKRTQ